MNLDRTIETVPLLAGPLSEHDLPGSLPQESINPNILDTAPDVYWRDAATAHYAARPVADVSSAKQKYRDMHGVVQNHLNSDDFRGARLIIRNYLNPNTPEYHQQMRTALRGLVGTIETPEELAELQDDHQRFHDFVDQNTKRLQKARKPARRQKLRQLLRTTELIESDMAWPLVAATCRIAGPEAAFAYMQQRPRDIVAEGSCLFHVYEQAHAAKQPVPDAVKARAHEVVAGIEAGIVVRTRLVEAMQRTEALPYGRTVLKLA